MDKRYRKQYRKAKRQLEETKRDIGIRKCSSAVQIGFLSEIVHRQTVEINFWRSRYREMIGRVVELEILLDR